MTEHMWARFGESCSWPAGTHRQQHLWPMLGAAPAAPQVPSCMPRRTQQWQQPLPQPLLLHPQLKPVSHPLVTRVQGMKPVSCKPQFVCFQESCNLYQSTIARHPDIRSICCQLNCPVQSSRMSACDIGSFLLRHQNFIASVA